jgi:hypothetical protein
LTHEAIVLRCVVAARWGSVAGGSKGCTFRAERMGIEKKVDNSKLIKMVVVILFYAIFFIS